MQIKSAELEQRGQIEQAQLQTELATDMLKAKMDDDRARDLADADFAIKAQQVQLDAAAKAQVAAQQAAARPMPGQAPAAPRPQAAPAAPPPGVM